MLHVLLVQLSHMPVHLVQVYGYCMFKDGEEAKISYPSEDASSKVTGRSFHNGG